MLGMCGNGHQGKRFQYNGRVAVVNFTTDYSELGYGFNITANFFREYFVGNPFLVRAHSFYQQEDNRRYCSGQ